MGRGNPFQEGFYLETELDSGSDSFQEDLYPVACILGGDPFQEGWYPEIPRNFSK